MPNPEAVHYAWAAFPLCNLFNSEGFAAYPNTIVAFPFSEGPEKPKSPVRRFRVSIGPLVLYPGTSRS